MARLPTRYSFFRAIWQADSYVSSGLFEAWDFIKRCHSAYSAWLYRYFRLSGPKRWFFDLLDDGVIFGVIIAFGLVAYALPPNSLTSGDVWNKRRDYAVTFTDVNGEVIGQRGIKQDDAIPLEEIPPHLIQAVLATEDVRFFEHFGVDILGTFRAAMRNAKSDGPPQGGSSITQQVAKNLFLSPEQTLRRKVHEAFLSLWIEARLSKPEILKLYLDRSYLGGGAYGIEAASQFYFGKSVRDITLPESAVLAGLFKAPTNYAPHQYPEASRARSNVVLWRMLDAGFITQGELLEARRSPVQIVAKKDADAPEWYLDWAYEDTLNVIKTYNLRGAYVIEVKTPIDRKLQREMTQIMNDVVDTEGPDNRFTQGSAVTMAPDGAVKAIHGGRNYENSQFNRATDAKRPSGSAFKPFVYLAALLDGYKPTDMVVDGPVSIGNWSPGNYNDSYKGRVTLTTALAKSLNSVPVRLSIDIGRKSIIETAHKVGIQGELETWAPMVLGTSTLTLLDLTTGYATFAGGGKLAKPYAVLEIRKPNGDVIYSRSANSTPTSQVVPEENIADLNSMLAQVVKAGTARRADLGFAPQGGKTGTNQGYRDAWYIGFTAHNVTGVWVGNDDYSPMNEVTGGRIPAPAWKRIMEVAEAGLTPESVAGIPLDDTYTAVAAADLLNGAPIADETPGVSDVAVGGETRDILDDISSLFQKDQRVLTAPESGAKSLYGDDGDSLILPKPNVRKKSRGGDFLESLFKPKKKKKKKKFFSF